MVAAAAQHQLVAVGPPHAHTLSAASHLDQPLPDIRLLAFTLAFSPSLAFGIHCVSGHHLLCPRARRRLCRIRRTPRPHPSRKRRPTTLGLVRLNCTNTLLRIQAVRQPLNAIPVLAHDTRLFRTNALVHEGFTTSPRESSTLRKPFVKPILCRRRASTPLQCPSAQARSDT